MGLLQKIQAKTEEARAKEKIRPLLESRMMRDILLEIGQRGTHAELIQQKGLYADFVSARQEAIGWKLAQ